MLIPLEVAFKVSQSSCDPSNASRETLLMSHDSEGLLLTRKTCCWILIGRLKLNEMYFLEFIVN